MAGKSYSAEEKAQHVAATKDFGFKLLKEYGEKHKISVNTLRNWQKNPNSPGPGRPKGSAGKGKSSSKRGRGRPKGSKNKTKANESGEPRAVASVTVSASGKPKDRIADFLKAELQNRLDGAHVDMTQDAVELLKDVYAAL